MSSPTHIIRLHSTQRDILVICEGKVVARDGARLAFYDRHSQGCKHVQAPDLVATAIGDEVRAVYVSRDGRQPWCQPYLHNLSTGQVSYTPRVLRGYLLPPSFARLRQSGMLLSILGLLLPLWLPAWPRPHWSLWRCCPPWRSRPCRHSTRCRRVAFTASSGNFLCLGKGRKRDDLLSAALRDRP